MGKKEEKTNVMRLLDQAKIEYKHYCYAGTDAVGGMEVVEVLHQDPDQAFKTLVTVGKSGEHYVFAIPVNQELDLKKAAEAAGEKSIAMIKSKELLPLTGYILSANVKGFIRFFYSFTRSQVSYFRIFRSASGLTST